MTVTQDATSGKYIPQSAAEWTAMLAGTGIGNPSSLWLCQDASGNLADAIGANPLVKNGTPTYQNAVSGWSTLGIGFTAATSQRFSLAAGVGPNPTTTSSLWLALIQVNTSATHGIGAVSGAGSTVMFGSGEVTGTKVARASINGVTADGTTDITTLGVHLHALQYDRTNGVSDVWSGPDHISGTYNSGVTDGLKGFGGLSPVSSISFSGFMLYAAMWSGSAAEMSGAQVATLLSLFTSGPLSTTPSLASWEPGEPPAYPPAAIVRPRPAFVQVLASAPAPTNAAALFDGPFVAPLPTPVRAPRPAFVAIVATAPPAPPATPNLFRTPRPQTAADPVRRRPTFFYPFPLPASFAPPYGPAGGGTFIVTLESGAQVTLEFATDVLKTWTGLEYRTALLSQPRQTYKASALLANGRTREVRALLIAGAATGLPFLLGLAYEEATCLAPAAGAVVTVRNTAILDWAQLGQRVIVVGGDGSTTQASVQGVTTTTITLGDTVTGAAISLTAASAAVGARIMPLVPVFIDPAQSFVRSPVNLEEWQIVARAAVFGYVGTDTFGAGATITTYADPTWGTTPVWDRGINATSTVTDSVQTLADLVDLGGVPGNVGSALAVDYGRQVSYTSDAPADWQWLKLFLATVRGRQCRFLLPTYRPDLVMSSNPGSSLLNVYNGLGYGDPSQFFSHSAAQTRLWLTKADGSTQIVTVTGYTDNLDGTGTLAISATATGTVTMISFAETCRMEADSMDVTFDAVMFSFTATARVVQQ